MRYALILAVAMLAATPRSVISQIELKRGIDPDRQNWWMHVQGLPGEYRVRIIASRNVAEQLRRDAIRELDVEVPAGALRNALARAGKSGGQLGTMRLRRQSAEVLDGWIYLHSVSCVTCEAAAGDPDKLGRVKLRFPSATFQAAAPGAT